jgi:flavin-dependent dehydrogenase
MNADVLIVGAGPAGSSIALRLARAGVDVALLERSRFPRTKVCGEYLSPGAIAALRDLRCADAVLSGAHRLRRVSLAAFGSDPVLLTLPGDGALSLSRATLDNALRDAALSCGAREVHGAFLHAVDEGEMLRVAFRDADGADRSSRVRVLIGADGAWSTVAARCGLAGAQRRGGRWAVGGHLRGASSHSDDTLEMCIGAGGYYARNPLGDEITNAMLVMPRPVAGDDAADAIVDELSAGRLRFEASRLEKRVAVGPLRYESARLVAGRVMLTGDAAGMLDPFVGQGVAIALESSSAGADAALALLAGQRASHVAHALGRARRELVLPRRILAAAVDMVIRTPLMRARAARSVRRDPAVAETVLAAIAGAAPAARALSPALLARLLA